MAYLYHVTTEENAKSILKNGLIPKIGERSQLVGETEKYVYLCGRKDVPFWSVDDTVKAAVAEMKDGEVDENNVYQYSYYSETLAETAIPAERIRKSRVSRSLTDEQMKDLAQFQHRAHKENQDFKVKIMGIGGGVVAVLGLALVAVLGGSGRISLPGLDDVIDR